LSFREEQVGAKTPFVQSFNTLYFIDERELLPTWLTILVTFVTTIAGVIAIMAFVLKIPNYIDSRVGLLINDESFIKKLGDTIRPSVVFDEKNSVLHVH
jgi:hypothetical protein